MVARKKRSRSIRKIINSNNNRDVSEFYIIDLDLYIRGLAATQSTVRKITEILWENGVKTVFPSSKS